MVKSDHPPVPISADSLPVFILKALSESPYDVAMVDGRTGEEVTFNKLILTVKKLALGLSNLGLVKGDLVGIYAHNSLEFVYALLASMMNGAVPALANPCYKTYELEHILKLVTAKWWVTTSSLYKHLQCVIEQTNAHVKGIILLDTNQSYPNTVSLSILTNHPASTPNQVPYPRVEFNPKVDPACILFSSGTTGFPKAVVLSHRNVVCLLCVFRSLYSPGVQQQQPVSLIFLPIFHVFGLIGVLFHSLAECYKVVILPRFVPDEVFNCMEKYKVTITALVPPIMVYMCKNKDLKKKYDLSNVKTILCGAAPLSKDIERDFMELYMKEGLSQGYGMTEATLAVLLNIPGKPVKKGSTGQVVPNSEVIIKCPETNKELGPNLAGEICVKSEQVMLGYLNDAEATRQMIDSEGWLHTGDTGYYDDDGYFYVVGRIKELIKYKGFQVAPAEIERLLLNHPSVDEVAVVGIPDPLSGEVPKAFVVKKSGHSLSADEVAKYVASRLSNYKHLRGGVEFLDSIPKTESGKYLRRNLVAMSIKPKSKL